MDACYINPFLYALSNFFQSMLGAKVDFGKPSIKRIDDCRADVSGAIGFSGDASGAVVLAFQKDVAVGIASKFAGTALTIESPDFADAIGELANMVAGGAKARFPNLDVNIAPPSVIIGDQHHLASSQGHPCLTIPCRTCFGDFVVYVTLKINKTAPVGAAV
ncbi:MAG: chemotaxis protein CheX [Phycisphaerales bacterium]|nr:chemotaxis protein CheX [Phycisphaerales bacterium]